MFWKGFTIEPHLACSRFEADNFIVAEIEEHTNKIIALYWEDPLFKGQLVDFYRTYANSFIKLAYEIKKIKSQIWLYITIYNKYIQKWEVRLA